MNDFSVELAAERIVERRTKEYFREVLVSFTNDNFRSATVMLWSVVVADLIYKLQALRDLYQDQTAISILDAVEKKQRDNPISPDWEQFLVKEVTDRTLLLEAPEYEHIVHLHKLRHLSAHPVINNADLLFSPNKETVLALIRNALESVLLKPPIFTRRIVEEFVKDIAERKQLLTDQSDFERYVDAKYSRGLNQQIQQALIKSLWKFCFRTSNIDTDANRDINVRALHYFCKQDPIAFRGFLKDNTVID